MVGHSRHYNATERASEQEIRALSRSHGGFNADTRMIIPHKGCHEVCDKLQD
jgi:hypothetical protein